MDADLPLDLVLVQLAELDAVVHLERDLDAGGLVDGEVHGRGVAAAELLGDGKLVDRPGGGFA